MLAIIIIIIINDIMLLITSYVIVIIIINSLYQSFRSKIVNKYFHFYCVLAWSIKAVHDGCFQSVSSSTINFAACYCHKTFTGTPREELRYTVSQIARDMAHDLVYINDHYSIPHTCLRNYLALSSRAAPDLPPGSINYFKHGNLSCTTVFQGNLKLTQLVVLLLASSVQEHVQT